MCQEHLRGFCSIFWRGFICMVRGIGGWPGPGIVNDESRPFDYSGQAPGQRGARRSEGKDIVAQGHRLKSALICEICG